MDSLDFENLRKGMEARRRQQARGARGLRRGARARAHAPRQPGGRGAVRRRNRDRDPAAAECAAARDIRVLTDDPIRGSQRRATAAYGQGRIVRPNDPSGPTPVLPRALQVRHGLPGASAELAAVLQKILAYESKQYGRSAVFAADKLDGGVSFAAQSDAFADRMGPNWSVQRVYLDLMPLAAARRALVDAINGGAALTAYVGHSSLDRWSFSRLLQGSDAALLANSGKLEPRVYRLPEYLDAEVARLKLESLGGGVDTLTPEQERYLRSWELGT